ncbi:MAG: extracellular solute-binding protein [Opitutaceae bacterium]|jgi:raffinose/stachyose/melibiose transport system substrate-binding protein|nr:extracellular solute-binding protein [Opitutaceae bacterium]
MKTRSLLALAGKLSPWLGLSLLVAVFALAAWRVAVPSAVEAERRTVIRIAHWQLEAGIRQGIDAVARAYEAMHPDVRIEQILVPERVYPTWLTTRLVGGTAPELIELVPNYSSDRVARYFRPLGAEIDQPNPYNRGTALEALPWRNTFVDGLASGYHEELADYYGAGPFMGSRALFYNASMLREVTGVDAPPANFSELERVLSQLEDSMRGRNERIAGFAMHRASATALFNDLFAAQLQRLGTELSRGTGLPVTREEFYAAHLDGRWDFARPELKAALENLRELSASFPPGFTQLGREDASLSFVQGRALFFYSGTWDVTNLAAQVDFPVGVMRPLVPEPGHPRFGAGVLGALASEDRTGSPAFSVTRDSPHAERAIDFLRFLTSDPGNRLFSEASGWMPSIVGVPGPSGLDELMVAGGGYPRGPSLLGGPDTSMAFSHNLARLTGPGGDVDAFLEGFASDAAAAMRSDLNRSLRAGAEGLRRDDVAIIAGRVLGEVDGAGVTDRRAQSQNEREASMRALETELAGAP